MGAPIVAVDSFAAPASFTRGLAFDGTSLWAADGLAFRIYQLDPSDGSVTSSFASPGIAPDGLAWDGTNLRHSDTNTDRIYTITTAGSVVSSFASPSTTIAGLAFDPDGNLTACDATLEQIHTLNPSTGATISTLDMNPLLPAGLSIPGVAWHGDDLWIALGKSSGTLTQDTIRQIDPSTGATILSFDGNVRDIADLTWEGDFLWVVSITTDTVYKCTVPDYPLAPRWVVGAVGMRAVS